MTQVRQGQETNNHWPRVILHSDRKKYLTFISDGMDCLTIASYFYSTLQVFYVYIMINQELAVRNPSTCFPFPSCDDLPILHRLVVYSLDIKRFSVNSLTMLLPAVHSFLLWWISFMPWQAVSAM